MLTNPVDVSRHSGHAAVRKTAPGAAPPMPWAGGEIGLRAYVRADPVNMTDPLGLESMAECKAAQARAIAENGDGVVCGGGGGTGGGSLNGTSGLVLSTPGVRGGITFGGVRIVRRIGEALDDFAESNLKPPSERKEGETREQCIKRIAGMSSALGVVGGFSIAAGGAWLGYFRGGIGGGGGGTSLISRAARGALGSQPVGRQIFGTGNIGGIVGRGLSKASVAGGAAAAGLAAGTLIGAVQRCQ